MPTLDRMREKHNDLVKQLTKAIAKKDKALDALIRAEAKVRSLIKAVARSQKRLDKARSLAALNAGPVDRSEPVDLGSLTPAQADAEIAKTPLPVFDMPDIPADLRREPKAKPPVSDVTDIPLSELGMTDTGKANAKSWNAIPAVRKAKPAPIPPQEAKELSALNRQLSDAMFGKPTPAMPKPRDVTLAPPKRKTRRTPDDFKAEIAGRKGSATRGRIAD